ncbi:amidase [Geodermatophilus sp. DSM 44513]|uniref:amidase n=1 Tax=Geodermatophilus sp. DSM 44513 TaxID=1528104 RepID=UPI001276D34F|nr:amidase [Geodermatophilus sp. DSM 44513]WNV75790.1 amidase [Geodermatophilus sp. DSM 44513]
MQLLDGTVAALAAAVRSGAVDAREVLEAAVRRIEERDGPLNAVVALDPEPALRRLARTGPPSGPLAGLPLLVKDLHAEVAGLPLSRGSRLFAGLPARGTSTLVARLEAAGALVLGRTNTPELGLNATTEPLLHGATVNPWRPGRSAGGSSGGAAAAVAAGMVPAAHATNSGGSTRIPAAWCGLVGLKPSRGRNPMGPFRLDDWAGLSHEHAVTRTVADSALLLSVTAGPAPGEPYALPAVPPELGAPPRCRVGLLEEAPAGRPVAPAHVAAVRESAAVLDRLGHAVVPLPAIEAAAEVGPVLGRVVAGHLAAAVDALERQTGRRASPDTLEPAVLDLLQQGRRTTAAELVEAQLQVRRLALVLATAVRGVDVVLSPTTAQPAPALGELHTDRSARELFAEIFRLSPFVGVYNVTGGPGLSLPWGLDRDGLPVGVHLGAAPGADGLVLGLAAQLEAARPDRVLLRSPVAEVSP